MDYERINHKLQPGGFSPSKLRIKLSVVQKKRNEEEELESERLSYTGETENDCSLRDAVREFDDRGVSTSENYKDVDIVLAESSISTSALACEMSPNLSVAVQSPSPPRDQGFRESQIFHAKFHNGLKSTSSFGDTCLVNSVRRLEDSNADYDIGHDNASVSGFEFQKADRASHRLSLAPFSKPAPSKWDDAHKWIANPSSVDNQARNKAKIGQSQSQDVQATVSRKAGLPGQGNRPSGSGNGNAAKFVLEVADQRASAPEEVDTKRIDPNQSQREIGAQKFNSLQSGLNPLSKSVNRAPDPYPVMDEFDSQPLKKNCSFHGESYLKPSLPVGNPLADSEISLSQHDSSLSVRSSTTFIPPPSTIRSVSMRDMGTEMTPIASQEPSRTGTPVRAPPPMCSHTSHSSTPGRVTPMSSPAEAFDYQVDANNSELPEKELQMQTRREIMVLGSQLGKSNIAAWASKEEEEKDASTSFKTVEVEQLPARSVIEIRAAAWEETEKAKYMARYKREEIKIQAWENHQKAKTEAEMRRIEVEVERMRGCAQEKLMNKLAVARHAAEAKRAAAEVRKNKQAARIAQQAEYIQRTGRIPSSFSCCYWCS